LALGIGRRWAAAESVAVRLSPVLGTSTIYVEQVLDPLVATGQFDSAHALLAREAKLFPGSPVALMHRVTVASAERKFADAERLARELQSAPGADPGLRAYATEMLASMAERGGKLAASADYFRAEMASHEERGLPEQYLAIAAFLADQEVRYRARPAAALTVLAQALAKHPLDSLPALDRPYALLAWVYARAGRVDEAKRLMRRFDTEVPEGVRRGNPWRRAAEGAIAEAEGRKSDAVTAYRALYDEGGVCGACGLYELATAYDALGRGDSARAIYQRAVDEHYSQQMFTDRYALAPSLKRLGELYEARGDRKRAAEYYARFVELWKDADPELQPGVRELRGRLTKLAQEPGT
jgi:tetratricopeptide (TPR) repeat protein